MSTAPIDRPNRTSGVEVNDVAGGAVLHLEDPERVLHLNSTAAMTFELCDGVRTVETIAATIGDAFSLPSTPTRQIEDCLAAMREHGVISPALVRPPRQVENLGITEAEDGLVIFEPRNRQVHHLNIAATIVFELCTGANELEVMGEVMQRAFALQSPPLREIASALTMLRSQLLIE